MRTRCATPSRMPSSALWLPVISAGIFLIPMQHGRTLTASTCSTVRRRSWPTRAFAIGNVDVVVIAQRPKLVARRGAVRANRACGDERGHRERQRQGKTNEGRFDGRRRFDRRARGSAATGSGVIEEAETTRARVSGCPRKMTPDPYASPLRAQSHRATARRQRQHGALQLVAARGTGGTFILRIEDTDVERSDPRI